MKFILLLGLLLASFQSSAILLNGQNCSPWCPFRTVKKSVSKKSKLFL